MPAIPFVDRGMPRLPKGLAKPDAACDAFAKRKAAPVDCANQIAGLSEALSNPTVSQRDALLVGLEGCAFPKGLVRALRAELAPPTCADVIVTPVASNPGKGMPGVIHDALIGLGIAGMLARAANDPPKMTAKPTKKAVDAFIQNEMLAWVSKEANAIEQLSRLGAQLRFYGKGVVAVEAGMAEMRFVDAIRSVPVPLEFENDPELRETNLQSLERALGPRKKRGRDAALVGLGTLATVGVLRDPRVERTRKLLSRMFGGRPMNALDALLLPPFSPVTASTPAQELARRLQTFYAGQVFAADVVSDPKILRMLVEKGLSLPHRIALRGQANLPAEVRLLSARAHLELGQNYWRRVDFDEATHLLSGWEQRPAEGNLILALALALRGGHANAADMMIKAPLSDLGIGRVGALDHLVTENGPLAGMAAFDAALIKKLAAPAAAPVAYWEDLAARFRKAHGMLPDIRHQRVAAAFAEEAEQTAKAIAGMTN